LAADAISSCISAKRGCVAPFYLNVGLAQAEITLRDPKVWREVFGG
jgi:hypothetical protein